MTKSADLKEFQEKIGYTFQDETLLAQAFTHSSFANEQREEKPQDYERLEFLGDAVLEVAASEFLYKSFPELPEGELTKKRAAMVCESGLSLCAEEISLGDFILMGRGEELSGGRSRASITSDAFEALTAAIHIDSEGSAVRSFIADHLIRPLENKELFYDAKTRLQEFVQSDRSNELHYSITGESGPVHDRRYKAAAILNGNVIGMGEGHSKKDAQQQAAADALKNLEVNTDVS